MNNYIPLKSLQISTNVYGIAQPYIFSNVISTGETAVAFFTEKDSLFNNIIQIIYGAEQCLLQYKNESVSFSIINNSINGAKIKVYQDSNNKTITFTPPSTTEEVQLTVIISAGFDIQTPKGIPSVEPSGTIELSSANPAQVFYGTTEPSPNLGQPGDLYIQIFPTESDSEVI